MKRSFYFILISMFCMSCQQKRITEIDADQLKKLRSEGITIVDIRTLQEYNQGHISGVVHLDFRNDDFIVKMEKMDKSKPIVIHCASGGRSSRASSQLNAAGFTTIYDYSGGFSDWLKRGEVVEK